MSFAVHCINRSLILPESQITTVMSQSGKLVSDRYGMSEYSTTIYLQFVYQIQKYIPCPSVIYHEAVGREVYARWDWGYISESDIQIGDDDSIP